MIQTFKTETREDLGTKFETQNEMISKHNEKAEQTMEDFEAEVREDLRTKFETQNERTYLC